MSFILIGSNTNITPFAYGLTDIRGIPDSIRLPDGMINPKTNGPYTINSIRTTSTVSLEPLTPSLIQSILAGATYNKASVMSLDGIFSPISLYPTPWNTTYAIAKYSRSKCPYCNGAGSYTANIPNFRNIPDTPPGFDFQTVYNAYLNGIHPGQTLSNIPCKFCIPDQNKIVEANKNSSPSEQMPPFLIGSGTDLEIIDNRNSIFAGNNNVINKFTLNPIVLLNGEFGLSGAKQIDDNCGHNINIVSFGMTVPGINGSIEGMSAAEMNKNYNGDDIDYGLNGGTSLKQNNQRFFAFRGPIMVHGWGYDPEGYPVPNSSGEFKYDSQGQAVVDADNNPVYKNQILQEDGSYSAPYKEKTFYKGWASLPNTWPVGPIDLRWDADAGVWTVGSQYKPVWITIEHDMTDSTPVRGVIEDGAVDATPLPNGLRRVVFVKDSIGVFKSPRGAALYCKYNPDNGFYEPIYNKPFIAIGTIRNTQQVSIEQSYRIRNATARDEHDTFNEDSDVVPQYLTTYSNPLNISVNFNNKGLFTFINGKWILTSYN
jgi:hypothetical protein